MFPECSVGTWNGSSHLVPTPQGRYVTTVLIFHTRKSGFRKVGDLAESLSLESQELTFGYLSVLKPACPPSPWLQPPLPPSWETVGR